PDAGHLIRGLASSLLKAGDGELEAGGVASARAAYGESATLRLRLAEAAPDAPAPLRALAVALERVGVAALAAGDPRAARSAWREGLALAHRIYAEHDPEGVRFCAVVEAHLAELGGLEAEAYRAEAIKKFDTLARQMRLSVQEEQLRQKLWRG